MFIIKINITTYFGVILYEVLVANTAQKNEVFLNDFFSEYDQVSRKLRIWSHLLKKSLLENFIICAV